MGSDSRSRGAGAGSRTGALWRWAVPVLALTAAVIAAAAFVALSRVPPALTDETVLAALPEGAEILDRHTRSGGRTQQISYRYTEEHTFCVVERTARQQFSCGGDAWTPEGEPETLAETEDWSGLAGYWAEQTDGPWARFMRLRVTDFDAGQLAGEIVYQDGASSWEGPAAEVFLPGERAGGTGPWLLQGSGFFRHCYLRVDRDGGIFFDNDVLPLTQTELPPEPPAEKQAETPEEDPITAEERTWLVVTEQAPVYLLPGGGEVLDTLDVGTVLACTGRTEDGWCQVEYAGAAGYVSGGAVWELPDGAAVGVVTATVDLNVRSGPGTGYDRLDTVSVGTRMVYTGADSGWYQVICAAGTGYVSGNLVLAELIAPPAG